MSRKEIIMKSTLKRFVTIIVAATFSITLISSAYALTNKETVTNTTKVNSVTYTTNGKNEISTTKYSYAIDLSTYISKPVNSKASEIHTHWQVYDYWSGSEIGKKRTEDGTNTNCVDGYDSVSITYYKDITVQCAHSAYKNGQTLIAKYTTTTN